MSLRDDAARLAEEARLKTQRDAADQRAETDQSAAADLAAATDFGELVQLLTEHRLPRTPLARDTGRSRPNGRRGVRGHRLRGVPVTLEEWEPVDGWGFIEQDPDPEGRFLREFCVTVDAQVFPLHFAVCAREHFWGTRAQGQVKIIERTITGRHFAVPRQPSSRDEYLDSARNIAAALVYRGNLLAEVMGTFENPGPDLWVVPAKL